MQNKKIKKIENRWLNQAIVILMKDDEIKREQHCVKIVPEENASWLAIDGDLWQGDADDDGEVTRLANRLGCKINKILAKAGI